jgi:hypothetical protein
MAGSSSVGYVANTNRPADNPLGRSGIRKVNRLNRSASARFRIPGTAGSR